MWAAKLSGEAASMYDACEAMRDMMLTLGVCIDGGKDSLSMAATAGGEVVRCPGELVCSYYVTCPDVTLTATPDFKYAAQNSRIIYVDLGGGAYRLGGSAFAQVFKQVGNEKECPDVEPELVEQLKGAFEATQILLGERCIAAGHDRSDGGLIQTLLEMGFAGNCGMTIDVPAKPSSGDSSESSESPSWALRVLFAEELGLVIEAMPGKTQRILDVFASKGVTAVNIGCTTSHSSVVVSVDGKEVLRDDIKDLRDVWEATSFELERQQCNPACVQQEQDGLRDRTGSQYIVPYEVAPTDASVMSSADKPKIAILREEGSNGDREMASAFHAAGFECWDVTVSDLVSGRVASLDKFRGIAFVGGFSYADVMDSAKGWAGTIKFNKNVWEAFQAFYKRSDTFSLGVCNGCQLMALLGWVPGGKDRQGKVMYEATDSGKGEDDADTLSGDTQPRFVHNESGRFESRWSTIAIKPSPASDVMLKGMDGSVLGVWVAHGEGRVHFPDTGVQEKVMSQALAPLRYVDDANKVTQQYPFNPNGSPDGIAGLCSANGRHLAMMPHPERAFMSWQWPHMTQDLQQKMDAVSSKTGIHSGPWLKMFQNAAEWCKNN
jgi:phosphoribosylformylglycinamidine synthase